MEVIDVKEYDPDQVYDLFKNESDHIQGKFSQWNGKDFITEVTLIDSTFDKKIEHVNYCKKTDAIEIHYYENTKKPFVKDEKFKLVDCKLDCVRIILLAYSDSEQIKECSSNDPMFQPEVKKGNIIVGNP